MHASSATRLRERARLVRDGGGTPPLQDAAPARRASTSALHATAVAIAGEALLIRGASGAGKSRLALALIARSTRARPIVLVGDDRILLRDEGDHLVATPHPRIAGFIERRGLGIVAMPWIADVRVGGVICIGASPAEPLLAFLPRLEIAAPCEETCAGGAARVLAWWAGEGAARATHLSSKARAGVRSCAKD